MRKIALANGRGIALVDDEDYDRLAQFSWQRSGRGLYVSTGINRGRRDGKWVITNVLMHRMVLRDWLSPVVDHISGDILDNRKANLRSGTRADNSHNTRKYGRPTSSIFKGVSLVRSSGHWVAHIKSERNRNKNLGTYATQEEAARAYDAAARRLYGEFACVNFPRLGERSAITGEIARGAA
jgi:hypothetical protein